MGRKRFSRKKGVATQDGSESIAPAAVAPAPSSSGDWKRLPTIGPVVMPTVTAPSGMTYRNNVLYPSNQDKVEVVQAQRSLNLNGLHYDNAAVKLAGSQLESVEDDFWPDLYVMLHEMAQYRDGYKSQDAALTTPAIARYRDEIILTAKINIRVLWALYHAMWYNEGMKTMQVGFAGKYRRMADLLEWSNKLIYPADWDPVIDYWSTVFTPYPGGPVCYNLFMFKALTTETAGIFTAWAYDNRPALELSADVSSLLDDIELALRIVDRYYVNVAASKVDYKLVTSLYKMMSFPTPVTGVRGLTVSGQMFVEQFKQGGFFFPDNKGLGADILVVDPDIMGDVDALIDCPDYGAPYSDLFHKGLLGTYAFDLQDSATKGYAATTEKIAALGLVRYNSGSGPEEIEYSHSERLYTQEDGWYEPVNFLDFTDAAGLQAFFWSHPHITLHPQHWVVIRSEEAEEDYRQPMDIVGINSFQMPWDHIGIEYRKFLHNAYKVPFLS